MTHDSMGADETGSGSLPDGSPVDFDITSGGGALAACDAELIGGSAHCTFNAPANAGETHLSVSSDNQAIGIALSIGNRHTPVLSWTTPGNITYGTKLSSAQLKAKADVPGSFVYGPSLGTILGAGMNQSLTATFTPTDSNKNIGGGTVATTINVNPRPLTVAAGKASSAYHQALPPLTYSVKGFANGDTIAVLSQTASCASTVITKYGLISSAAGSYPITCGGASATNYVLNYVAAPLTVRLGPTTEWFIGPTTISTGKKVVLSATLSNYSGGRVFPIADRRLTLTLSRGSSHQSCVTGKTNKQGVGTCVIGKVSEAKGAGAITASYDGDQPGVRYFWGPSARIQQVTFI